MSQFSIEKSKYYVFETPPAAEEKEKNFSRGEGEEDKKNSKGEKLKVKVKEWLEETTFFMSLGDLIKKEKDPIRLKELFALHKKMVQLLIDNQKVQVALEILGTQEKRELWFTSLLDSLHSKNKKGSKSQSVNISKKMLKKALSSEDSEDNG
jgi:hypothetical protein